MDNMKIFIKICALATSLLLVCNTASAEKLKLPLGMGGVPDIGAIPCEVFSKMIVPGPLGTKRSLLTWGEGYFYAKTGKTIDEIIEAADQSWDFDSLTAHLVNFCAAHPDAQTSAAVIDLGEHLLQ